MPCEKVPVPASSAETLTLSFRGLVAGDHPVLLTLGILDDATLQSGSTDELVYATGFTIHVAGVPEPASAALIAVGLAAILAGAAVRHRGA